MHLFKKGELLLCGFETRELAEHLEELGDKGLLVADAVRGVLAVEVGDDLLELLELRVGVDEEGVDGEEVEVRLFEAVVPGGELETLLPVIH